MHMRQKQCESDHGGGEKAEGANAGKRGKEHLTTGRVRAGFIAPLSRRDFCWLRRAMRGRRCESRGRAHVLAKIRIHSRGQRFEFEFAWIHAWHATISLLGVAHPL